MEPPDKRCFICNCQQNEKIIILSSKSLRTCKKILDARIAWSLLYSDVLLPVKPNEFDGYHPSCYKNFSSIKRKYLTSLPSTSSQEDVNIDESDSNCENDDGDDHDNDEEDSSASIDKCVFCDKSRTYVKRKSIPLSIFKDSTVEQLKHKARELRDHRLLGILQSASDTQVIKYHSSCRLQYMNKITAAQPKAETSWHFERSIHAKAFEQLEFLIEDEIVSEKKSMLWSSILSIYEDFLREAAGGGSEDYSVTFSDAKLTSKVSTKFKNKVQILKMYNTKIICPSSGFDENLTDEAFQRLQEDDLLKRSACVIRKRILDITKVPLPRDLKTDHIISGECSIPQSILKHYESIVCGQDRRRRGNDIRMRKVKSICQDLIYAVHNGKMKTSKHMLLGLVMKSMTSSKKVIDILNRCGHSCSYSVIEELETELTYNATESSQSCPESIKTVPDLCTTVAFDNFDRYVETASGKDTLHDTVGIIFQFNKPDSDEFSEESDGETSDTFEDFTSPIPTSSSSITPVAKKTVKRRRAFEKMIPEIPLYHKKPKLVDSMLSLDDLLKEENSLQEENVASLATFHKLNFLWVFSHANEIIGSPMWVGFNSRFFTDKSLMQTVAYLTPINVSPTAVQVVRHLLDESLKIMRECSQQYIRVTADLAIAKVLMQIQSTEAPLYKDVFIDFGFFHIWLAYMKAMGKFHDGCGLTHMMIESGLLASGSINGFIKGTHFNRCKRLYPIISLALQILHFESYLECENIDISNENALKLQEIILNQDLNSFNEDPSLLSLFNNYFDYKRRTLAGEHGKTPQYYLILVQLIDYYLLSSKSIRTGNFPLLKYILPKITNLFFVMNQPNYSRWMVKYFDNLLKIDSTHPGLREQFERGAFGVRRTEKSFSRQPIDLTLEQTINADAGKRLTGVTHFTNSIGARQRWAKSHSIRSSLISYFKCQLGLSNREDITAELDPSRIKNNVNCLKKFMETLKDNINPFDKNLDGNILFNISTGRGAKDTTAEFLLNVESHGEKLRRNFIQECHEDNSRFEGRIQRQIVRNFAADGIKKKIILGGKVQEVRMQRDLFGRLLGISLEHDVNMEKVMGYPVTPIPLSMCHFDGKICKTTKSVFMKYLEGKVNTLTPPAFGTVIIDGFFLIHLMIELPKSFGSVSKKILNSFTYYNAARIDIVFDRYFVPSIKETERNLRDGFCGTSYVIHGPEQQRPTDFKQELKNSMFKEALVDFFIEHWASDEMAKYIGQKTIYLNHKKCYSYRVSNNKVVRQEVPELECPDHEEADTKIVFHVTKIIEATNVLIRCSDTDILIIMLGNMEELRTGAQIWMEVGTGNNARYINVSELHLNLGSRLCNALPGLHAFTGCDYNPSFFKKGKTKPFDIMEKSVEYQMAFRDLGKVDSGDEFINTFSVLEKFICELYGKPRITEVNKARYEHFLSSYKCLSVSEKLMKKKMKNLDAATFPPCRAELYQQYLRAKLITSIWKNAYKKIPSLLKPEENGWSLNEGKYEFKWFEGDQMPGLATDVIIQPENSGPSYTTIADEDQMSDEDAETSGDEIGDELE